MSIEYRIREGLSRLATVLRADEWDRAKSLGLNPTQLSILTLLEGRPQGLGVREIAVQLGVSQPSASDSINALERKGHVEKHPGMTDARSVSVRISKAGINLLRQEDGSDQIDKAIGALEDNRQEELLVTLVSMIRDLQERDAVPVQRMCTSCRHFDPFLHPQAEKPYHCHFVNAAFGRRELRVDCRDHEQADPTFRAATWEAFQAG
ncbi:MarR family winged helix-turn-helix transcriptional regulator [Rhizobium panacihumi]|uniref:MarR family winged helix-turn-helix transcriptional regulator n=1 Tax=Rhizobium panacihumi TaxID=2008450 RepID=UPI003D7AA919